MRVCAHLRVRERCGPSAQVEAREQQAQEPHYEESHRQPASHVVTQDDRQDGTERQHERSPDFGAWIVDRDEEEIDRSHGKGKRDGLVGILGVESVELGAGYIHQDADSAGSRRPTDALDHQEHAKYEHDSDRGEDDQLIDDQGEAGDPFGGGGCQLEPGVVRAHRQDRVGGEQGTAIEQTNQGAQVGEFVEAVQQEWLEHHVGREEPDAQCGGNPDAFGTSRRGPQEAPGTGGELERKADEEQEYGRRQMSGASDSVGRSLQEQARPHQREHKPKTRRPDPESRQRAGALYRRLGGGVVFEPCSGAKLVVLLETRTNWL